MAFQTEAATERRENRRAQVRERILSRARALSQEKGPLRFTMDQLARASAISVGSIYLYFASDNEVRAALLAEALATARSDADIIQAVKLFLPGPMVDAVIEAQQRCRPPSRPGGDE